MKPPLRCLPALLIALTWLTTASAAPTDGLRLPPGFVIEEWAGDVPGARTMVLGERGTVFVGSRDEGRIYALRDDSGDGRADHRWIVASGLQMPNGLALRDGQLYVADVDRLLRLPDIEHWLEQPPQPMPLRVRLPADRAHGWRYIAFGPDGWLYAGVGAPCNVCERDGYAQLRRISADGERMEVVAQGIRNTVGFAWRPGTRELWFTENGRDWLGDDRPPDEINILYSSRAHFGFPYCHGDALADPQFGAGHDCSDYTPPALALPAHVAPLGILFYTGQQFPAEYRQRVFIAEHGSWNRSRKIGYRVMMADIVDGRPGNYRPFIDGFLQADGSVSGRPSYLLQLPDGSLLLSDDHYGRIYRIHYAAGTH